MQYHGVKVATPGKSWSATACVSGRPVYLGVFADSELAARAFDRETFRATGDLRRLNFPDEFRDATVDLRCRGCGAVKPVADFRVPDAPWPKTLWHCAACHKEGGRARADRHKAAHGVSRSTAHRRRSHDNGLSWLVYRARSRASECGAAFDIDLRFVRAMWDGQRGLCRLTGRPMLLGRSHQDQPQAASIDRIDSNGGYNRGNVQLACWAANVAKQRFTTDEFVELCRDVIATLGEVAQENR